MEENLLKEELVKLTEISREEKAKLLKKTLQDTVELVRKDYGPVLATKYAVVEVYPAREDEDGNYQAAKTVTRLAGQPSENEADLFLETHQADSGATLKKVVYHLRERTVREWTTW